MDERQSRKLRQLQAEMIALANDREKATSADACRAIDAKLRALAERGAAMKHVKMSPEEKPCAACKRPTARTVVSEGRAHRFCSVECASSGVRRCSMFCAIASRSRRRRGWGVARGSDHAHRTHEGVRWTLRNVVPATASPRWRRGGRTVATPSERERDTVVRHTGQRSGWSQTDGSAGEAPPRPRKPIGALTRDAKKDEQEDRDTIVACGAARRRRQRRPDVVLDSTPRRVAPPPDGTLRVAGAPQKLLPAPPPPPEALLDGFESDEVVEDSRTGGGGGWGRGFL